MSRRADQLVVVPPLSRGTKLLFLALVLMKLWLVSSQTFTADSFALDDDFMYIKNASSLLAGKWLGPYDNLILAKGPMYPLWMAFSHIMGVPLWVANNLLYAAAGLTIVCALRPLVTRRWALVAIFALTLFNPISWALTRAIREQIYFSLALLVIACGIGLYLRRAWALARLGAWATGLGCSLAAFWLTREESVWILPYVGLMLGATMLALVWERPRPVRVAWVGRLALCLLPVLILAAGITSVSAMNYVTYGVWVTNDFSGGNFPKAVGALMRVEPDHWQQYNLVPRETRERVYQVSPAFKELEPDLEGTLGQNWALSPCGVRSDWCGDIYGGWFLWAMRDAVRDAGHYKSGPDTQQFLAQIAREVNAACDQGKLRCGPPTNGLMPSWHREYFSSMLDSLRRAFLHSALFQGITPRSAPSLGTPSGLALVQQVTGNTLAPAQGQGSLEINGWAASPSMPTTEVVLKADGTPAAMSFMLLPSLDVANYLNTNGKQYKNADNARFIITTDCMTSCQLVAFGNGKELGRLPLDRAGQTLATGSVVMHIDTLAPAQASSGTGRLAAKKDAVLERIRDVYGLATPILVPFGLLSLLFSAFALLRGRRSPLLLFSIAAAVAFCSDLVVVAYVDSTSFLAIVTQYLCCTYVILPLAIMLSLWEGGDVCRAPLLGAIARARRAPAGPLLPQAGGAASGPRARGAPRGESAED